ncbi:hypothetical protein [Colwellia sp. RSH04]|uniref:hypothetical protein n=1 Tax=Colwellia sp. RSH04 TaxID=2305464 RepID=UPI0015F84375|nr:hypothetical protein [Colwellia sp. RSH04]
MTLLVILACVFFAVFLMVIFGEKYAKPISVEQQSKYSKLIWVLVFILIIAAIIKNLVA